MIKRSISILFLGILVPLFAQDNQILNKLDILIQQQQSIVRKLKQMEISEIEREVERLEQNIQLLREVKLLVMQTQQEKAKGTQEDIPNLKENLRQLYNRLYEIPMATRSGNWPAVTTSWIKLQSKTLEAMSDSDLALYQNQLQSIGAELRTIELEAEQKYKEMLTMAGNLYVNAAQEPWVTQFAKWKQVETSWEKSWDKREEKGLAGASHYEQMYLSLLEITNKAKEQKDKALKAYQATYQDVQTMYEALSPIPMATHQTKWIPMAQKWHEIRDIEPTTISPQELKRLEIELVRLHSSLLGHQMELTQELRRIYEHGESLYQKARANPWAQEVTGYTQTIAEWKDKWENKQGLGLIHGTPLEAMNMSLERLHKNAGEQYQTAYAEATALKPNIAKLAGDLENAPFVKKEGEWFETYGNWQELQYVALERATPAFMAKYQERLTETYKSLQKLYLAAQKEAVGLLQKNKDLYQRMAKDTWMQTSGQWLELSQEWTGKWAWKNEIALADTPAMETIFQKFQILQTAGSQRKAEAMRDALHQREELRSLFNGVSIIGSRDAHWPQITKLWNQVENTLLDSLNPQQMQEYFATTQELRQLLEKAYHSLRFYCVELLSKTNNLYDQCLKDPWTKVHKQWTEISQKWASQRPLHAEAVTAAQGPFLETAYQAIATMAQEVESLKEAHFAKVGSQLTVLTRNYRTAQKLSLMTSQPQWQIFKTGFSKWIQQEYRNLSPEELAQYEEYLHILSQDFEVLQAAAAKNLENLWNKTRKLNESLRQNPWTLYLLEKSPVGQLWETAWKSKTQVTLEESEQLLKLRDQMERCMPFWWRPQPPQRVIPEQGFVLDMTEIKTEGVPTVPQWSYDGETLAFLSLANDNWSVQLLDPATGNTKAVELYDPAHRWVAFPTWAPAPFTRTLTLCGKKMGFHDLYRVDYSRTQSPDPVPITDTPELEKNPHYCLIQDILHLFFLRGNDICYIRGSGKEQTLMPGSIHKLDKLHDLAVCADTTGVRIALCGQEKADRPGAAVYVASITVSDGNLVVGEMRKTSELAGHHFAPVWTGDGRWLVGYLEDSSLKLFRIDPQAGREKVLSGDDRLLIPAGAEMRFKGPEIIGPPFHALYFTQSKENKNPLLTLSSVESLKSVWQCHQDPELLPLFYEADQLTVSSDRNFMSWTFFKEGEGKKLAIAVVRFPELGQ